MDIKAELISIGNELLSGRTLNTHGKDLGGALTAIGLQLGRDTTVPDQSSIIQDAVRDALERTELVFVSGGLGPTVDDITRDALSEMLGCRIILDPATLKSLEGWYESRGRQMTAAGERQAQVLEGCIALPNPVGAAPGQRIVLPGHRTLFVLPGPPNEFNAILDDSIIPWLKERYADVRPRLVEIVRTKGIGESDIVTILEDAGFNPADIDLGFYPGMGRVEIRLTAPHALGDRIKEASQTLRTLLADFLDPDL